MYRAGCRSLNSPHSHLHAPPRDSGFCRWIRCSRRSVEADSSLKPVPHERPEMTTISVDPTVPIPMLCHNLQDVRAPTNRTRILRVAAQWAALYPARLLHA